MVYACERCGPRREGTERNYSSPSEKFCEISSDPFETGTGNTTRDEKTTVTRNKADKQTFGLFLKAKRSEWVRGPAKGRSLVRNVLIRIRIKKRSRATLADDGGTKKDFSDTDESRRRTNDATDRNGRR